MTERPDVTNPEDAGTAETPAADQPPKGAAGHSADLPRPLSNDEEDLVALLLAVEIHVGDTAHLLQSTGALPEDTRRRLASELRETASWLSPPPAGCRRLSVNITPATGAALDLVVESDEVTYTEAVRRLIGLGALVDDAWRSGHTVLIDRGKGRTDRITPP